MEHAWEGEVVEELAGAGDEARVFASLMGWPIILGVLIEIAMIVPPLVAAGVTSPPTPLQRGEGELAGHVSG